VPSCVTAICGGEGPLNACATSNRTNAGPEPFSIVTVADPSAFWCECEIGPGRSIRATVPTNTMSAWRAATDEGTVPPQLHASADAGRHSVRAAATSPKRTHRTTIVGSISGLSLLDAAWSPKDCRVAKPSMGCHRFDVERHS
jgi:hypothetical protein